MTNPSFRFLLSAAAAGALLCGAWTRPGRAAPPDGAPAAPTKPDEPAAPPGGTDRPAAADLSDPAFDAYVDPALLGRAWADHDPALLADAGLQLAEGERVLMRTHKSGIDAEALLELAVKVAADKHDKATLDRLAKAAERQDRKALAGRVAAALKLAGQARSLDPALMISVEDVTPEDFVLFQQNLHDIQDARIAGDRKGLDGVERGLPDLKDRLPAAQIETLKKLASEARSALPADDAPLEAKSDKLLTALRLLADASRDVGNDRQGPIRKHLAGPSRDTDSTFDDPTLPPPNFNIDDQGTITETHGGRFIGKAHRFRLKTGQSGWVLDLPNNGYHIWRYDGNTQTGWRLP